MHQESASDFTNSNKQDNEDNIQSQDNQNENQKKVTDIEVTGNNNNDQRSPEWMARQLQLQRIPTKLQYNELSYIMFHIFRYPSLKQAEIHTYANRLGMADINKQSYGNKHKQYCKCCGYLKQEESIPLCTSFDDFLSVGVSIYLFFQTIKHLIQLLVITTLVYGIYSLVTNIYMIKNIITIQNSSINLDNIISWLSLNSKVAASSTDSSSETNLKILYMIEMWIGVGLVVIWSLLLYVIKYFERKNEVKVNKQTISAADFSILIQNYPRHLTQESLQKQLDQYAQTLQCKDPNFFKIQTINTNVISNARRADEQKMEQINQKYTQMLEMFADWVCSFAQNNSFPFTANKRKNYYQMFRKLKELKYSKTHKVTQANNQQKPDQIINDNSMKSQIDEDGQINEVLASKGQTIALITFKYSNSKDLISKNNEMNIAKTIRHFIRCCPLKNKLVLKDQTKDQDVIFPNIKISKAPQPEDIKWQNLQVSYIENIIRKAGTYLITFILLGISFSLVYLLSMYQINNSQNFYLNFIVSLTISIINFIIGFLIRFLTIFEKDYTQTGYQTSLALKSIGAQLLNSIVIPIIVNYILQKKNIFGVNGLSSDVIYLSITNSFLPPLAKLIDPYHKYIKLRAYYFRNSLRQRLLMKQNQLNESQQLMDFQTGYQYIYFVNLYLFTAYFISLQPCISIFAILGMIMMYWIQKYTLLNRIRRPIPGTDLVNTAIGQLVNLGPIFYAIGTLSWSHFLDGYKVQTGAISYYVPNIVAGGLAAIFFIFPFNIIFDKYLPKVQPQNLDYKECRILLNSEYDRCNPATMQQAIKQYEEFVQNYIQEQENDNSSEQFISNNKTKQQEINNRKKLLFNLQQSKYSQKQEENSNIDKESNGRKRKVPIDKNYITRKRQLIKTKTLWKKYESNGAATNIYQFLNDSDQLKQDAQPINQNIMHNPINPTSSVPLKKQTTNYNLKNSMKISKDVEPTRIMKRRGKQNEALVKKQPINIQKTKQTKPKKVNIDFKVLLPLDNPNSLFQSSPQNPRDDSYRNYFSTDIKIGSHQISIKQNHQTQRQRNNPYEKSFR